MRKLPTKSEEILWERLRRNGFGYKFRRQHPVGNFIPDFYCHKKKLAIELDGTIHNKAEQKLYDIVRAENLNGFEIKVMRFPNWMIEKHIGKVLKLIETELNRN